MITIDESVHIDRPVSEVFAFVTDPEHQTLIASNLIAFELDRPHMEKGAHAQGTVRVAGKKVVWTAEITEHERDRRVEWRSLESPMDFHITWTYEERDGGTHVRMVQEVPDLGGFFGKLADAVVTKLYTRDTRGNLDNLKVLLEEA